MKYEVTFARFGTCVVDAETEDAALAAAEALPDSHITWSDDRLATDAAPVEDQND